jgi:hypothetical protein
VQEDDEPNGKGKWNGSIRIIERKKKEEGGAYRVLIPVTGFPLPSFVYFIFMFFVVRR